MGIEIFEAIINRKLAEDIAKAIEYSVEDDLICDREDESSDAFIISGGKKFSCYHPREKKNPSDKLELDTFDI